MMKRSALSLLTLWKKVGNDGVITVEDSQGFETTSEGCRRHAFDRGYLSPYMVTDTDKMEAILDNPYIMLTDKRSTSNNEILPLLEKSRSKRQTDADHC